MAAGEQLSLGPSMAAQAAVVIAFMPIRTGARCGRKATVKSNDMDIKDAAGQ